MPVIHITTWPLKDENQVESLMEDVTHAVHKNTGAPLDKISVILSEVSPSRWSDAGVLGTDISFQTKSRRKTYEG
ncbi:MULTISPECIES: 2-hydroxymuconate tautomerase [Acinetobacter]|uniref:2-hydroxymuconate tautomerase n=1 Tax=Acinetobacter TaxID=469 RepID=UPI00019AE2C4|nr:MULTISPECIES: 2-hydroxymuconate tautomerase [Acinetobacter]EEH67451.1 tautomerase enzyme [Acinetobacter sp. ATCC 27244]NAS08973.1 tautomerase [Acinetobacter haemolyticus]SUU21370.1 Probable tautomerase SA1195.1 [Acinetobacter haemolyticus]